MRTPLSLVLATSLASAGCATTGANRGSSGDVGKGVAIGVLTTVLVVVGVGALAVSALPEPGSLNPYASGCDTGCD